MLRSEKRAFDAVWNSWNRVFDLSHHLVAWYRARLNCRSQVARMLNAKVAKLEQEQNYHNLWTATKLSPALLYFGNRQLNKNYIYFNLIHVHFTTTMSDTSCVNMLRIIICFALVLFHLGPEFHSTKECFHRMIGILSDLQFTWKTPHLPWSETRPWRLSLSVCAMEAMEKAMNENDRLSRASSGISRFCKKQTVFIVTFGLPTSTNPAPHRVFASLKYISWFRNR